MQTIHYKHTVHYLKCMSIEKQGREIQKYREAGCTLLVLVLICIC